jgi:pSer/pThr/pTyr-binding forkhead associated (FHA) protein
MLAGGGRPGEGQKMPAQLVALSEGPNILLDKPVLLLGRHPECDIQIDSRKISRRHCCIAQVEDHLVVRDLGSTASASTACACSRAGSSPPTS